MLALRYLLALLLVSTAIACAAPGTNDQPPRGEQPARHENLPSAAAGRDSEPAARESAEQVVARLAARVPTAQLSVVYNAQTDPNELLGTPNAYVSKAAFTDSRIDPAQADDATSGSIELGGSVEVFRDEADARARKQYIDQTIAQLPLDVREYSSVYGPVLLRLSKRFTQEQAAEYEAALTAR